MDRSNFAKVNMHYEYSIYRSQNANKLTNFWTGWIEFADKKIARQVAESLNNTLIGGKKGGFYHDDTWNLKYLSKFK